MMHAIISTFRNTAVPVPSHRLVQPQLECSLRKSLRSQYMEDLRLYTEAIDALQDAVETDQFIQATELVDRTKKAFEFSRDALQAHCAEHGCQMP